MKAIVGSTQSKYVAAAISITILVLCVSILVTKTDVPIGKRLLGVLFMVLITVPGVVLSLIELTCLVTGGSWKTNWWCWLLAWVIATVVIVWCIIIIATTFNTILTYTSATKNINETSIPATEEESNDFAENILANSDSVTNDLTYEEDPELDFIDNELDYAVENDISEQMMEDPGLDPELDPELDEELDEEILEEEDELQENNYEITDNVFMDTEVNGDEFVDPLADFGENNVEGFSNCSSKKSHDLLEGFKNKREYFKNRKLARHSSR